MTTANMGLTLPVPGSTSGGSTSGYLWAAELTTSLEAIDAHNHTSGSGARVPTSGLNINAALSFGDYDATRLRSTRYTTQGSTFSASDDVGAVYVYGGDLYYRNTGGTNVQVTSGGSVNAAGLSALLFAGSNKSADFTIGAGDNYAHYRVDATAATRTATLPLASGVADGRFYYIERTAGTNNITVAQAVASSDTVNGAASYTFGGGTYAAALVIRISSTAWVAIPLGQQLNGASVPEAGSLTTGNVLQVSGSRALTYGAVNLAGGSNYVSGQLPGGNVEAATTSTYGVISLQQDLGGTGSSPTVIAATGAGGVLPLATTAATIRWAAGTATPTITQANATGGAGAAMHITAQTSTNPGSAGGSLYLESGQPGAGGNTGHLRLYTGAQAAMIFVPQTAGATTNLAGLWAVPTVGNVPGGDKLLFVTDGSASSGATSGGCAIGSISGEFYTHNTANHQTRFRQIANTATSTSAAGGTISLPGVSGANITPAKCWVIRLDGVDYLVPLWTMASYT